MLHQSLKSYVDTVIPTEDNIVTGYSRAFHVVSNGTFGSLKIKRITVGVATPAAGSVVIQVYNKRSGIEASLLSSAITHDTAVAAASFNNMLPNTILVAGDLLLIRVMSVTGNAKGLSVTIDFE